MYSHYHFYKTISAALFVSPTESLCDNHHHPSGWHALKIIFYRKITGTATILTWYGDPNGNWDSLWTLHKSPSASKVACPHTLIRVHLQGVVIPAQKPQPSNMWFLFSQILYVFIVSSIVRFITTLQAQTMTVFRIRHRELISWCPGMWHHVF
jgi:hypothetical protein